MCSCKHTVLTEYNTNVCLECGVENTCGLSIIQTERPMNMCPFPTGYSRHKRFAKIMDGLLFPTPCSADNKMLEYLDKKAFTTTDELVADMKCAKLRDKRYTSIHLFARLFVKSYKAPPKRDYHELKRRLLLAFQSVEFGHLNVCPQQQFFNYNWLLTILLAEVGLNDHLQYVKNLRCKNRKEFYTNQLAEIRSAYTHERAPVYALDSRTQTAGLSDDQNEPPAPTQISTKIDVVPVHLCKQEGTDETLFGSSGSYRQFRVKIALGEEDQTRTQPVLVFV